MFGVGPLKGALRVGSAGRDGSSGDTESRDGRFAAVAIAASVGGVQALKLIVAGLPADFPLPVLICMHVHREYPSLLPEILARCTPLRVTAAETGMRPEPGTAYAAPSNRHLLVGADGLLALSDAERVNWCRPAADVLFRSVAAAYGAHAIGVVLTGYGQDGALGARAIAQRGGLVIAQDRASAEAYDMPLFARDLGGADLVLPLDQMADALSVLAGLEGEPSSTTTDSEPALPIRHAAPGTRAGATA